MIILETIMASLSPNDATRVRLDWQGGASLSHELACRYQDGNWRDTGNWYDEMFCVTSPEPDYGDF